jgi:hypothetical protein
MKTLAVAHIHNHPESSHAVERLAGIWEFTKTVKQL